MKTSVPKQTRVEQFPKSQKTSSPQLFSKNQQTIFSI